MCTQKATDRHQGIGFLKAGQARETSKLYVEATIERKLGHGQRDGEVQGVSKRVREGQRVEKEEGRRSAKPGAASAVLVAQHAVPHGPYRGWCLHCVAANRCVVLRVIGLKGALEANIKQECGPNMPVMTFMVNHAR